MLPYSFLVQLHLIRAYPRSLLIFYFQDTRRMGLFTRSICLLALLFQSNGERVTFTHTPLINKVCASPSLGSVHVREHHYCHWHCMKNTDCFAVNYGINTKRCWLLSPCNAISDFPGYILTVYGTQEYIRSLRQDQWQFSACCPSYICLEASFAIKFGMKWLIDFQTATVKPLKFGNEEVTSSFT